MGPITITKISAELWLILTCLFAPAEYKTFDVEIREGKRIEATFYIKRDQAGFEVYVDKEMTKKLWVISSKDDVYTLTSTRSGKAVLDNNKY